MHTAHLLLSREPVQHSWIDSETCLSDEAQGETIKAVRGTCTWLNNADGKLYLIPPKPGPCSRCAVYYPVAVLQTISEKLNENASRMDLKEWEVTQTGVRFRFEFLRCIAVRVVVFSSFVAMPVAR